VPTVEGLAFAYTLHPLPPGRFGFRRWRWELWHGRALMAAGWRVDRAGACRALQAHGTQVAARMFGLRRALPDAREHVSDIAPGSTLRVEAGAISFVLIPRALAQDAVRAS